MRVKNDDFYIRQTNREIAGMLALDSYDITKTVPQGCWIFDRQEKNDLIVWLKLMRYDSDLVKLSKKYFFV